MSVPTHLRGNAFCDPLRQAVASDPEGLWTQERGSDQKSPAALSVCGPIAQVDIPSLHFFGRHQGGYLHWLGEGCLSGLSSL